MFERVKSILLSFLLIAMPCLLSGQIDMEDIVAQEAKHASQKILSNQQRSLSDNYDLKYHKLEWTVNPVQSFIQGTITSLFVVERQGFNQMVFDLSQSMNVQSVVLDGMALSFSHQSDYLTIAMEDVLPMGSQHTVVVSYSGAPDADGEEYLTKSTHNGTPILWTFAEPFGAKEWWPCKQDLNDKIDSVDIYVTVPSGLKVASNGTLESVVASGSQETHHWKHRFPIPAYLIAFAVTNYEELSVFVPMGDDAVEILNYVYPESMDQAVDAMDEMMFTMTLMNEYFGDYPYKEEKYGHAEWGRGGGMEHATMSFMGSYNSALIMHELAHQWFGDKITCGSWEDIWLNEGFASYTVALYYERKWELDNDYPYWTVWRENVMDFITSEPGGSVMVEDTLDVSRIFNSRLSYRKGAYLLRMLSWEMGEEDFFQAIRNYLEDPVLAFGYAKTPDLIAHLQALHDEPLDEFFDDWYYGEGYPHNHVRYVQNGENLTLNIIQYQSHPSVSFFEFDAPLRILGTQGEVLDVRLDFDYSGQFFEVPVDFTVAEVLFDPELFIISNENSVTEKTTLLDGELTLDIYPNPVQDQLTIKFNKWMDAPINVSLYDSQGRKVIEKEIPALQKNTISLLGISSGVYHLYVQVGDLRIKKSVVISE